MEPNSPSPLPPKAAVPTPRHTGGWVWAKILIAGLSLVLFGLYLASCSSRNVAQPEPTRQPDLPTATLPCVQPALMLGASSFPLEALARAGDGLPPPPADARIAGWVADTFAPYVFLLATVPGDGDLQSSLQPGDPMVVQWADCGREEYVLSDARPDLPEVQDLLAQTAPGIVVIVQPQGGAPAYALYGERPGQSQPETPEPTEPNAIQADITFGDTTASEDGKTLATALTITNRGSQVITVSPTDLSLTVEGQGSLAPLSVEPALPQEIQPGESLELTMVFPNPGGNVAVLKVLDLTVDLYY